MPEINDDTEFVKKLEHESEQWVKEGILGPFQREKIVARYRVSGIVEEKAGPGKLIVALSVLGAVLVGIGIVLFFASMWKHIPRYLRLALLIFVMSGFYGAGYYLRCEKANYPRTGGSLIFLGTILFGANMFFVAQMFNMMLHYPNGPLVWALLVLPLGYILRSNIFLYAGLLTLPVWVGLEAGFWVHGHDPFSGIYFPLYCMSGIVIWNTGLLHRNEPALKRFAEPYINVGAVYTLLSGYVLTFNFYGRELGSLKLMLFYGGMALLFVVTVVVRFLLRQTEAKQRHEIAAMCALFIAVFLLTFYAPHEHSIRQIVRISAIIVYTAVVVGVIILGYVRQYRPYVNIGIVFFILNVIARYFDLFYKVIPHSLFFIAGGIILMTGGIYLEKKRRAVLAQFNVTEETP